MMMMMIDKYDVINDVKFLLLSAWLRGARWAWRR